MSGNKSETNPAEQAPISKVHSLYVRILTAFIAIILITILPIIIYGYYMDSNMMLDMADSSIQQATKAVIDDTTDYLMPLSKMVEFSSKITEIGALSLKNREQLEKYTYEVLKFNPHTTMFYFGDEQGNFLMARRLIREEGLLAAHIADPQLPDEVRRRPLDERAGLSGLMRRSLAGAAVGVRGPSSVSIEGSRK